MKTKVSFIIFFMSFLCFAQERQERHFNRKDTIYAPVHAYDGIIPGGDKRDFYRSPLAVMNTGMTSGAKDTIILNRKQVKYIRNIYLKQGTVVYYDTIAIDKLTAKPLNGFYKINGDNGRYDTAFENFKNGSPFLTGTRNRSTFYRSDAVAGTRWYVIEEVKNKKEALKGYAEDYIPLASNQWRREIKTWPSGQPVLEDTVYYQKGRMYIDGVQNIYDSRGLVSKSHVFDKGKLSKVTIYQQDPHRKVIISTDLAGKDFRTVIEEKDAEGTGYKKNTYILMPEKKCQFGLLDAYYTGIERGEQCFVQDGYQYIYKGSAERNQPMDTEEIFYYDRGILTEMITKNVNKKYTLADKLTLATYEKPMPAWVQETVDYKDQRIVKEYFSGPGDQLIVRTTTRYLTCISHPLFESYPCNRPAKNEPVKFRNKTEYYDSSGKLIFESTYDENFKGSFEEDINIKFRKK